MSTEANKELARRFVALCVNQKRMDLIDEFLTDDFVNYGSGARPPSGRDVLKRAFALEQQAFSDLTLTIDDLLADGDRVIYRATARGVHTGEFLGLAPTGAAFDMQEIHIWQVKDGKFVAHWGIEDVERFYQQVGVPPQPRPSAAPPTP